METGKKIVKKQKNNVKKMNVSLNSNKLLNLDIMKFYKENLMKLHIIIGIIMVILYVVAFFAYMNQYKNGLTVVNPENAPLSLLAQIKENAVIDLVIIFAGITPYFYISILGSVQSIQVVNDMVVRHALGLSFLPTLFLGGLIQIIGYSLCIAVGLYYCRQATKKKKYYTQSSFTFNDLKKSVYSIRKDEKKVQDIEKEQEEKARKREEYNIKIPYKYFIVFGVIAFVIETVGLIITKI